MKFSFVLLLLAISSQLVARDRIDTIPPQLITNDSVYWTYSTLSNTQYVNTTPGAYYGTTQGGGGMIVRFNFLPGGKYKFQMYVQVNTYGLTTDSWTDVEGKVVFAKNEKGQTVFTTRASKGHYRYTRNGKITERDATPEELKTSQARTYLWDIWNNPNDKNFDYLLILDLTANPEADPDKPETIRPDMITKMQVPKRK